MQAISIIHDEHRSLAAVLHGMLYLVRDIKLRGTPPNFPVFDAMIHYVDTFQERFHHLKDPICSACCAGAIRTPCR